MSTNCCCIACVQTGQVGYVEACGEFQELVKPGIHFFCYPFQMYAGELSLRVQQLEVRTQTKTKDDVTVTVCVSVQYQVLNEMVYGESSAGNYRAPSEEAHNKNQPLINTAPTGGLMARDVGRNMENHGAYRAFYKLTDVRDQLRAYIEDVVRSEIPRKTLDESYASKSDIANAVRASLQHEMSQFGYSILNTLVTDLAPDARVADAMNQINAQRRLRLAAVEKAEADKILLVKAAEAEAEGKYLAGVGVARQRKAIVDGLKESVKEFSSSIEGTTPADVMQLMMVTQYLDMMKDVGTNNGATTLFVPSGPGGLTDVQSQVRQGLLEANLASSANATNVKTKGKK